MATEDSERFDQVDWNDLSRSGRFDLSTNSIGMLLTTLPLALLGVYDWRFTGQRTPTFEFIGLERNLESLDFFFIFTLFLAFWYLVLPLYQNPRMTRYYWKEFKRNRPAVVSLGWLGIVFVGGLVGPLVMNAPQQDLFIAYQPPVFTSVVDTTPATCVGEVMNGRCYGTWQHPLGTTQGGKDVFTMIVYGMTISMQIAFITTTIVATIGISFGTLSAYAGGWVDEIMMRFVDIILSFPTFLMFLLILYIYGAGLGMFIVVFSLFAWGGTARYIRSKSLSISEEEFIKASRISGASTYQVIRGHVVPNAASSIITQLTLLIPGFLLAEAQLAFLGIGDSTVPSWGQLISAGRSDLSFAPWIVLAPGIVLFLTILAFNFLGDALLDALNPEAEAENE
ncbi:ABC transporter permease [Halorubrum ezzemoulense]|jgi:peptide/nickel transport system permease protein|uniref:ABC transporter permease n=2 Tax=Halorubrum ezzemoulense TaxID=337243 RepID=A0A256J216_HALEZ|nr:MULTISPECIES: ABC transporter permease [Halorubrum]MDB2223668.1 ABC transporter permease [Halorubrum ezzemoulense]MDB2236547.1 ABC transporter permease [Halorubrum ezzemoulense]MDB2241096.1 ABC transporter permease [Halorubrum ezzemoulense]MDB2244795.1 ABC transporter permease [Halorubrum ezzemoulense]MDB2248165.1 ABC transporter permease [Halorubrum ezzemoulense]